MEKLIAGVILGWFFADANNRGILGSLASKGAAYLTDALNKKGGEANATVPGAEK